ncbi:MAG: Nramp family divalent metal transporter [Nocardioides sp.]|uniref:Nramp family divalent metal transporter n=1 Tax=Nocardioides sp. TaxID=35761 RepID=UPI0039E3A9E9
MDRVDTGVRPRQRRGLSLLGPAFITAVAYVDPGNVATNMAAGSHYGYLLVWVVILSNLIAMLVQYLSAKVGIATGTGLAALCRDSYPRPVAVGLWVQAELVCVATDLAEVVGGALALRLLFGLPMLAGGIVTGVVAFVILGFRRHGSGRFATIVMALLGVILVGFALSAVMSGIEPAMVARGSVPHLAGSASLMLAVGILGATVMPHAIYLHSGLTSSQARDRIEPRTLLRAQRADVVLALSVAGAMNLLMLLVAAAALGGAGIDTIEGAHAALGRVLGAGPALLVALALLASGLVASSVGTLAGQMVMEGFLRRRIPDVVRRAVTLAPALVVLGLHVDPTLALVLSQIVLSFGVPFALVPLVQLSSRAAVMGRYANRPLTTRLGWLCASIVVALNLTLLIDVLR